MVFSSNRIALVLSACAGMLISCKPAETAPAVPGSLVLVQGNLQQIQGGLELPNPVVVRVSDVDGAPLAKFPVGFQVVVGGGSVTPGSALTDENGEAKVKWVLGPADAVQTLHARVSGLDPVIISAFGLLPSDLVVAQGNAQSAKTGAGLPNPIVIRVLGPNNTPMKGVTVAFQVTAGGGLITPQSAVTNALGEVTARWTMGATVGTNSLLITSGTLQPIALTANAT